MRAVLVAGVALAGCGVDMGPSHPWVSIDTISGKLAVEDIAPPSVELALPSSLRIVTYNLQYGPDPEGAARAILDTAELARAGVVLVQEIESYPAEQGSRASRFAAALGFGYVYVPAREVHDGGTHGLAIVSKYPISNVEKMDLPDAANKTQHRIAIRATLDIANHPVEVIDIHLDTTLDAVQRIAQLSPAVVDAPDTVVVGGDFNTSFIEWVGGRVPVPVSVGASDQAPIVQDYMTTIGFDAPTAGSGPTEHMFGVEQRLDAIYTRGYAATFGGVEHVGPSDHWPMWIDIQLQ